MADAGGKGAGGKDYAAPALEKGFDVIELLATVQTGLTISEIAQRLGRSISEIFRIIIVMERRGWLHKDAESDRYRVTYKLLDIAYRATPAHALAVVAVPVMHDLAHSANQSCHLVVRADSQGMVIQRQENSGPVGFGMRLGAVIDLAASCSGHVLLAFVDDDRIDAIIEALPPSSITAERLRERLRVVRDQGYELQPSARTAGVTDISYPVFGFDRRIVAALTVPFLATIDGSQTASVDQTRLLLRDAAERISHGLGWATRPD